MLGLFQKELGLKAGIYRAYIGEIERGELNGSLDNIGKLAKTFKIKLSELFN